MAEFLDPLQNTDYGLAEISHGSENEKSLETGNAKSSGNEDSNDEVDQLMEELSNYSIEDGFDIDSEDEDEIEIALQGVGEKRKGTGNTTVTEVASKGMNENLTQNVKSNNIRNSKDSSQGQYQRSQPIMNNHNQYSQVSSPNLIEDFVINHNHILNNSNNRTPKISSIERQTEKTIHHPLSHFMKVTNQGNNGSGSEGMIAASNSINNSSSMTSSSSFPSVSAVTSTLSNLWNTSKQAIPTQFKAQANAGSNIQGNSGNVTSNNYDNHDAYSNNMYHSSFLQDNSPSTTGANSNNVTLLNNSSKESNQPTNQEETIKSPNSSGDIIKLLHSHVESLIPGERIIMFLSHVKRVCSSSNPIPSSDNDGIYWCCAITFYRVILFPYTYHNLHQYHLGGGEWREIKSNATTSNGKPKQFYEKRKLIQMPLGSLDRVEKIEEELEYKSNTTGGVLSSQNHNLITKSSIKSSEKSNSTPNTSTGWTLIIHGKDNSRFIRFTTSTLNDSIRAHQTLNTYAFPGRRNLGYLFAFESRRADVITSQSQSGGSNISSDTRKRYDVTQEFYHRLKVIQPSMQNSSGLNSISSLYTKIDNVNYRLCNSYPSSIIVPRKLFSPTKPDQTQKILWNCAAFRSGQRLPALTWARSSTTAGIWRCAQPKVGIQGNRSAADEKFIQWIGEGVAVKRGSGDMLTNYERFLLTGGEDGIEQVESTLLARGVFSNSKIPLNVKILDMRSKTSAMGNRGTGYGYESTTNYPNTSVSFCNITNIHGVRDAYQKLSQICMSTKSENDVQWGSLVEDTKWLYHIRLILQASWVTAFHIHYHNLPVLIHCSHGWDRTSQVAALAQIFLDPYYRTFDGFACLIEKDFLSFGHPFHTRAGHGEVKGERSSEKGGDNQVSPIFIQFLDCAYQIVHQFPDQFEFNERYLLLLSEHVYSCRFGTLLCDNEQEREFGAQIRKRTHCLWDYMDSCKEVLRNETYQRQSGKANEEVLIPPLPLLLRNVVLWTDRHFMWSPKPSWKAVNIHDMRFLQPSIEKNGPPNNALSESSKENDNTEESSSSKLTDVLELHCSTDIALAEMNKLKQEVEKWKKIAEMREDEICKLKNNAN